MHEVMYTHTHTQNIRPIKTWAQFDRNIRSKGCRLLDKLDNFPKSILVAGCQRSGTTILARLITQNEEMVNYWFGQDDELDAALILSGHVNHKPRGRYCFQTTYLNNCVEEYFSHQDFKLIWVLRNPFSVVYSMLHNWRRSALNRLFKSCGSKILNGKEKQRYNRYGVWATRRIHRACFSYNAKVSQIYALQKNLSSDRLLIIDYEDLIADKQYMLSAIYKFADLKFSDHYALQLSDKSANKATRYQSSKEAAYVKSFCQPVYDEAKALLSIRPA